MRTRFFNGRGALSDVNSYGILDAVSEDRQPAQKKLEREFTIINAGVE